MTRSLRELLQFDVMSEDPKATKQLRGQYVGGVIAGIGVGFGCSLVIYGRFAAADIENTLPLVSVLLLCCGVLYARYSRRREATATESGKNVA